MRIDDAVEHGIEDFLKRNEAPTENYGTDIHRTDGTVAKVVDVRAQSRQRRAKMFRDQEPVFRACLNIIINAACFITYRPDDLHEAWAGEPPRELIDAAHDEGITRSKRDRKRDALRRIENGDFTRIKICGRDLFSDASGHSPAGHGVSPRAHWRRGHWRRQRHGVRRALIVLRWIRPTIVKKGSDPLVETRLYEVDQPTPQHHPPRSGG